MTEYALNLLKDVRNVCIQTPTGRSDKQRKENIYRACKQRCNYYLELAQNERDPANFNRPSEEEIRIHFLSNMISNPRSEFNISLTSEEYASHIVEICEMAARDEERHNGNANN